MWISVNSLGAVTVAEVPAAQEVVVGPTCGFDSSKNE
jgi:hypothetical protein